MTKQQQATAEAMEQQRPFSWIVSRPTAGYRYSDVQCGVYLTYRQQHFQTYKMTK